MNKTIKSDVAKVVIVGNSAVGKTSLLVRFSNNEYKPAYIVTTGIDLVKRIVEIDGKKITIELWDTAGQERMFNLSSAFLHGATGIIIAYAINDRESFGKVQRWMDQVQQAAAENACKILIGTKVDLSKERAVEEQEGKELAKQLGIKFFETSAQNDINIHEMFFELAREIKENILDKQENVPIPADQPNPESFVLNWQKPRPQDDSSCKC